jgi:hypothetical protein
VVLSFYDSILLRNTWGRELLINTVHNTKLIERGIPKLGPIVTMNGFQIVGKLIVQPQSQALKVLKHVILAFQEENPRVTRIVIDNDKNIHLSPMERTREGPIMFIWSNYSGCSDITVLIREWEAAIILP